MNGLTKFPNSHRYLLTVLFALLMAVPLLRAQFTPCATPPPTAVEMANVAAAISSNSPGLPPGLSWEIPVRITVFRNTDGSGWPGGNYDNAFMDAFLSNMNAKLGGGPNTFHFFRCGPINIIDVSQLYNGSLPAADYSYNRNFLNLYIYNKPGNPPSMGTFPWQVEPKAVWLPSGLGGTSDAGGFHELGHTVGLLHTFSPEYPFIVPVTSGQEDHPTSQGGRELMITADDTTKLFPNPNGDTAGDRVADTPPGCDSAPAKAVMYPSSATIAGCLDNDQSTPCKNGCLDGDQSTPCINGCSWDYNNCTIIGTTILT